MRELDDRATQLPKVIALRGRVPILAAAVLILAGTISSVGAVSYYLATDVPATLGGMDNTTSQILRSDSTVYSLALDLGGSDVQFSSVHRRPDGVWFLSDSTPFLLGSTPVTTRDIVAYDGTTFSVYFNGVAAGIPEYARIDATFLDAGGNLVLSFDVPVNLGGLEYSPADLVRFSGGVFSLFWDGEAAGVPSYANMVGADRDSAGTLVVSFDVPVNLAGTEYLPGQLVQWNGAAFSSYFVDPAWPPSAELGDFAFVPAAGAAPDGGGVPGTPLTVSASGGNLTLSWGTSCATSDTDYEIYEGTLGTYYSHAQKLCSTGGATTIAFAQPAGSTYYLVVPKNAVSEGSYGRNSDGTERPQGAPACMPQQVGLTCP